MRGGKMIIPILVCVLFGVSMILTGCGHIEPSQQLSTSHVSDIPDPGDIAEPIPTVTLTPTPVPDDTSYTETSVEYVTSVSPDGVFRAENYGENTNITAAGLYPAEGMRIVRINTKEIVWDMTPGYYRYSFTWSPDTHYLAVSYSTRTDIYCLVIDLYDFSQEEIPIPEKINANMRDFRPDSYFTAEEWDNENLLKVAFEYVGADELNYSGTFLYNPQNGQISDLVSDGGKIVG